MKNAAEKITGFFIFCAAVAVSVPLAAGKLNDPEYVLKCAKISGCALISAASAAFCGAVKEKDYEGEDK